MNNLVFSILALATPSNCDEDNCNTNLPMVSADSAQLENILSIVFGISAAVAVLVIVISGINFATGGGDSEKISRAKKSIIFALVGLAIALSGEIIVLTILTRI